MSKLKDLTPQDRNSLPIHKDLHMLTQALFFEWKHNTTSKIPAPYCLKNQDHRNGRRTYKSMYLIYMSCHTEYEAAMKLLGSYPHWQKLLKCKWFHEYVVQWREDMRMRDESVARAVLMEKVEGGNVPAARAVLAELRKDSKPAGRRGRPLRGGSGKSSGARTPDTGSVAEEMLDEQEREDE